MNSKLAMPERDVAFDILYNKSLGIKDLFIEKQQKDTLALIKRSEQDISEGKGKVFFGDNIMEEIEKELDANKDERTNKHRAWLNKISGLKTSPLSIELIEYLWENQRTEDDPIYFHYWLFVDRILNMYRRFEDKKEQELDFQCSVVSELLHQETPYSREGKLPVIKFSNRKMNISIIPGDPVSDGWLVLIDINKNKSNAENHALKEWLTVWQGDMYCKEHIHRLLSGLPESTFDKFANNNRWSDTFHACVKDDYDLHAIICVLLAH